MKQSSHVFRAVEATTVPFWAWRLSQFRHSIVTTLQTQVSFVSIGHRVRAVSPGLARRFSSLSTGFTPQGVPLPAACRSTLLSLFKQGSYDLSFAQILSEFGGWRRQSPPACEQTARCRDYCQQKAVMATESMVVTGQYVAGHSALPSNQSATLPACSSVSAINTICSGRDARELTSNLRER